MEKRKNQLIAIIFLVSALLLINSASALTASSDNYSVSMFGTGMATADPSSTNYESESLSTAQSGTRNAESDSYTVNLGFFNNTAPYQTVLINSYSVSPSSAYLGSTITFFISTTNAQSTWARITLPDSATTTLSLNNNGNTYYVPQSVGSYNVVLYANSSVGGLTSVVDSFEILSISTTPPSGGGPSGGGGTNTIIEKCTYNWDCTPWSLCADGKQTRVCKNIGTCEGNESKPIEEMPCSKSLFDIVLKFKEIGLTQNETLKFSVDLIEKMGAEKLDVYIKYSIIDDKNNELWSQIETRAVLGDLTYEKEMSEMKLKDGNYILRVDILYGNLQRAFAEQKFTIKGRKISTEESISVLQRTNIFVFIGIGIIALIIILLILYLLIKFRKISIRFGKIERGRRKYKRKHLVFGFVALFIVALLTIILKTNITGRIINNLSSYNRKLMLIPLLVILFIVLLIILRKKIVLACEKIIEFLSKIINNQNKYSKNSIKGLINKKVYSDSGNYVGKVKDIILGDNKINSLKIKLNKRKKVKTKGIIIKYKNVKSVGHIVIVNGEILRRLDI